MKNEIEAQFLDINKDDLRTKLAANGGKLIQSEIKMKRVIFDAGPHQFIRVRDEGNKIVLTYKNVSDDHSILGTKEINVVVDDYDKMVELLECANLEFKARQETLREEWEINDCEICIDTWPWIPSFVEIEGASEEKVWETAQLLGFEKEKAKFGSVDLAYNHYYGVECEEVNHRTPIITFDCDLPKWVDPEILKKINPMK